MNWTTEQIPSQKNRIVIVTGANSGIGYETAKALAAKGATVVMACRNLDKANEAAAKIRKTVSDADLDIIPLDLADLSSVRKFATLFNAKYSKLDLLINNAGVMVPPLTKTKDGFELQFGANHLGHFALTNLLLEKILATPQARIVNVSSGVHHQGKVDFDNLNAEKGYAAWGAYAQSKLANLLFTLELNQRLTAAKSDAIATAAHPGWTLTGLQNGVALWASRLLGQQAPMGALPTLYAATSADMKANDYAGPGGFQEMRGYPKKVDRSAAAKDPSVARRLWQVSEELTGMAITAQI